MSIDIYPAVISGIGATTAAAATTFLARILFRERITQISHKTTKLKEAISKQIASGMCISLMDAIYIGRGFGVGQTHTIKILYNLYAETEDKGQLSILKTIIEEYNRNEPFEALPAEARPSLARIACLCALSGETSDKELLHPITKLLDDYQNMKRDHHKIKKQGYISYIVALVSFFIGVVGLFLALTGPSKSFITEQILQSQTHLESTIKTQQGAAANP